MSDSPNAVRSEGRSGSSRRDRRREATRREILDAAWAVAAEHGLGGIALRDLGARVGLKAQSLYSYFPSKHAILDAMFAQGASEFLAVSRAPTAAGPDDPRARLREHARRMFAFSQANTARYQLLFQRPIPGFEPSPEAYAPAVETYEHLRAAMAEVGITRQASLDLWTALLDGLTDQQVTNDPGGDRWAALVDDAVDMWFDHVARVEGLEGTS